MAFTLPNNAFRLTAAEMGTPDLAESLKKGIELGFLPREKKANLESTLLKNIEQEIINKYKPQDYETLFASRNATTQGTNLENQLRQMKVKYPGLGESGVIGTIAEMQLAADRPDLYKNLQDQMTKTGALKPGETFNPLSTLARSINAELIGKEALASYRGMGGGRGGVSMQQQNMLIDRVKQDNPNFTQNQVYEAAGNIIEGNKNLNDGTPININPLTLKTADIVSGQGVPAAVKTQTLRANQAEAELQVLSRLAQEDTKPYANTFAGYSPQQIADTFKNDKQSQERLGRFIASQAAQYEIAQIRNRIAGGEPGITATTELMGRSGQIIKTLFPQLSGVAREAAAKQLDKYLKEALNARNAYGSHFSKINSVGEPVKHEEITMEDIEHTAKQAGISVQEVIKKLKEQGRM